MCLNSFKDDIILLIASHASILKYVQRHFEKNCYFVVVMITK